MQFMAKICGIKNLDDALRSVDYGANALGFNFYPPSPRYLDPERADRIIEKLPPNILAVAVLVVGRSLDISPQCSALQLHGLSSEADIPSTHARILVATSPEEAWRFPHHEIVIDVSWGRGKKADWEKVKQLDRAFILSGGLTPGNVVLALQKLQPVGVDVCSGVESIPGNKDPAKLKQFLSAVQDFVQFES